MNIYGRIKSELHTIADINGDGKVNKADIASAIDYFERRVGTGWQGYTAICVLGMIVGAFLMWVF